ncbi:MAG TPA: alkaline phosphatase family protein [Allosphingosinicella sp.]|jgi:predicted AlkP superfamily pyrophosphatase or phosphodiesterase
MKLPRLTALLALPLLAAAPAPAADRAPPKLIVAISVDQFSADLFAQYRQHFTGGLRRLAEGVVFPSGYQSHNATETCPGHSTILTGSRPARTGIIANNWFDQNVAREDKEVYCSEDPRIPGSSSDHYTVSTYFLKVPTLGDWMKRANPRSRSVAVAGKDRAAIMMGGYDTDQRWYWTGKNFTGAGKPAPAAAGAAVNAGVAAGLARAADPMPLPDLCEAHSRAVAVAGGGQPVGTGRFARAAGDSKAFRVSPELDAATLQLALGIRKELGLGEGAAPDLLAVGVSATDYVGHTYGTQGSEMCIQLLALDHALGDFFRQLDATGIDYVVMLTADHGGHDIPERHAQHGIVEASRADNALSPGPMSRAIAAKLKLKGPVLLGDAAFGDMYIDRSITGPRRRQVLKEAIARYRAHPQVAAVFTHAELLAARAPSGPPETWTLLDRAKASFDPERSGDFIVLLQPRVTPIFDTQHGYVATHGSPWDYDRRVPILFWRKGMVPFEQSLSVETVDILPTLAGLAGVPLDLSRIDGRCLDLDEGPGTTCPAGWERR